VHLHDGRTSVAAGMVGDTRREKTNEYRPSGGEQFQADFRGLHPVCHRISLQFSKDVTSDWGWNLNAQPAPAAGVSVNTNSSGTLVGYTIATDAGASATYGKTWCKDF